MSEIGLPYYVWLLAGLGLCAAETLAPGAFLIWIGAAGLILGAVEFFAPMALTVQLLGFAALVAGLLFVGRRVYGSIDAVGPSLPMSRAHALMGREFFLDKAIARGFRQHPRRRQRLAGRRRGHADGNKGARRGDRRRFGDSGGKGMSREFSRPTQGV